MNHSGSPDRVRTTLSTPSPPTPKCRSHSAATRPGVSSSSSSKSGTTTKSFPVPCPLANRMNSMLVRAAGAWCVRPLAPVGRPDGRQRAFNEVGTDRDPHDSGIAPEPRLLAPDEPPCRLDRLRRGRRLVPLANEKAEHLCV